MDLIITRARSCRCEAGATSKSVLSRLCAGEAARFAPPEQAGSLAIVESVLRNWVVALAARGADAKLALHAGDEAIVLDAGQSQILRATLVLLVTNHLGISERSLVVCRARASGDGMDLIITGARSCRCEA